MSEKQDNAGESPKPLRVRSGVKAGNKLFDSTVSYRGGIRTAELAYLTAPAATKKPAAAKKATPKKPAATKKKAAAKKPAAKKPAAKKPAAKKPAAKKG